MKSTVKDKKTERDYPKLMISLEDPMLIVLFDKPKFGAIVCDKRTCDKTGNYEDGWEMSKFKDFDGEVTLSNE